MKKIMLTGGTGFVGGNIIKGLVKQGYEVGVLCRNKSVINEEYIKENKVKFFKVDSDLENIIQALNEFKPECVMHLASLFIAEHKKSEIEPLIMSNILYPTKVLEAMSICNIKKFINTGTCWQHFQNEEYNPVCLYAGTKESFEKVLEYYTNAEGFKAITLKLFDTYGENDTRGKLINVLKDFSINGQELNMTDGEQKLDLTHIDDVVKGYICAYEYLDTLKAGEHKKYAICTGRAITLKEILKIFENETGYNLKVNFGKREYRKREVMIPWSGYELLPNWKSEICLEEGVKRIVK